MALAELGPSLTSLKDQVDSLYYFRYYNKWYLVSELNSMTFRDHFFETHSLDEAGSKPTQLKDGMANVLQEFSKTESSAVEENRAMFLYLKGKLLNINGEFNSQAETLLSR